MGFSISNLIYNVEGGYRMRSKTTIFILTCMFLLANVEQINANELQRLVFNAAGSIGLTEAFVELQGITPGNSAAINGYINTAVTMLNQLASQYNDPPFDSDQIRKIVAMLQRFPQATDKMNNRGKASYLRNCYTNLKSAMSVIFRSDFGLKYNSTCDTYVAELGYHCAQAVAASQMGESFRENMAKSGVNLALDAGTRIRNTLGCSFLTDDQARSLNVPNLKTPGEFTAMARDLENIVRVASLNLEPGFDSPVTKRATTTRIPPPPPADDDQAAIRLVGRWQTNSPDESTQINFVQEGPKIRGYICNIGKYTGRKGYRENEMIMEVTRESDRKYTGSFLFKEIFRGGATVLWQPARIELTDNTGGAGRSAKIIWMRPTNPTNINPEDWWHYHRVD